jgi:hypothetical protein
MILSGFGFEVAMGTSGYNGSRLLATSIRVAHGLDYRLSTKATIRLRWSRIWQAAAHCTEIVGHMY